MNVFSLDPLLQTAKFKAAIPTPRKFFSRMYQGLIFLTTINLIHYGASLPTITADQVLSGFLLALHRHSLSRRSRSSSCFKS